MQRQLTIRGLARDIDVNAGYMRDLLYDNRTPSERVIIRLSEVLGLNYDELMKRTVG